MRSLYLPLILVTAGGLHLAALAAPGDPRLEISPSRTSLELGQGVQLRARLKGAEGEVRWSIREAELGTVTAGGYYQSPNSARTPSTVHVVATVEGQPELQAEAQVILKAVSLEIKPKEVKLAPGDTARFQAKVKGTRNPEILWSVDGDERNGRITRAGVFNAPASFQTPGTITVRAASAADPTKQAVATVRVQPVSISIEPKQATVRHGQSKRFKAKVKGTRNTEVIWRLQDNSQGEISDSGLYTTSPTMTTPAVVTIVAAAAADPTKTVTARVTVPEVQIRSGGKKKGKRGGRGGGGLAGRVARTIVGRVARLYMPFNPIDLIVVGPNFRGKSGKQYVPLGGAVSLGAVVENTTNDRLVWALEGDVVGTLTEDGFYHAPDKLTTPHVVQVRATSTADPTKSALHTLHIPPVHVHTRMKQLDCLMGGVGQLEARVENTENDNLVWSVEGGDEFGTVTRTGLYRTPPSLATPATVQVRAASEADPTKFVLIQVNVPAARIEVSPGQQDVRLGRSVRLNVKTGNCVGNPAVEWRLTPDVGTISPDGVYRAPEETDQEVVQVTAVLKSDPTKTATATLRLRRK